MNFKTITYEEDRLSFFIDQRNIAEKKYKRVMKQLKPDDSYISEIRLLASETGQELSFYNDVVEMLARDLTEKIRVKNLMEVQENA